jgi:predicted CoA-binding protein
MMQKKVVVLGASLKPSRFSNMAVRKLLRHGHLVTAIGNKIGSIESIEIQTNWPENEKFHTVTLYLNPYNQEPFIDKILAMKPERIIFNPGTENPQLAEAAKKINIETIFDCTLVMLDSNQF